MTGRELEQLLEQRSRQAIHLASKGEAGGRSRLGGLPDLPPDFEWPRWKGQPLAFLAQLDLAKLPRLEQLADLPATGMLYFFYDYDQSTWGGDPNDIGSWRVIYSPDSVALRRATAPRGLKRDFIYKAKLLSPRVVKSYPSLERLDLDFQTMPEDAFDIAQALREKIFDFESEHQIGGYPNPVQGEGMEGEAQIASRGLRPGDPKAARLAGGKADWQLLLQIDSDDDSGMMWGDSGRLYFWISRNALAKGDFSRVWMVLQCS